MQGARLFVSSRLIMTKRQNLTLLELFHKLQHVSVQQMQRCLRPIVNTLCVTVPFSGAFNPYSYMHYGVSERGRQRSRKTQEKFILQSCADFRCQNMNRAELSVVCPTTNKQNIPMANAMKCATNLEEFIDGKSGCPSKIRQNLPPRNLVANLT